MISRLPSLTCLVLLAAFVGLGGAACSGGGATIPECNDGLDNDDDGLIDDVDPACALGDVESGDPPVACNDGDDNDGDGLIDFPDDPGCATARDTDEFNVRTPECMDEIDNDGDGKTDFPNDPGCFVANQDGEEDDCPTGPNCPECGDGVDNDADGMTDYPADSACASAAGSAEFMFDANACGTGTVIADLPSNGQVAGTIPTGPSNVQSSTCNGRGAERAFLFVVDHPVTMVASTDSGGTIANTVLYVRRNCMQAASEVACHDDISATNNHSRLTVDLTPGTYYLVVDGRDVTTTGSFQLSVIFYEGLGEECTGPANCAPGYTCRAVAPSTTTTCELPVCSDGRDDDGDTLIDFPSDPGCTSLADTDETDTCPGTGCPACGDGMDNDLDGATDYPMDTSCQSASGTSEADCPQETDALIPIVGSATAGTTVGASNSLTPTCGSSSHTAPERAHLLDLRVTLATFNISLTSSFDAATSILNATCGTTIQCADPNTIARTNVGPGHYIISVDGWSSGSGTYTLNLSGTIAVGGSCADPLVATGTFTCATGSACAGPAGMETCVPAQCNDMIDADGDGFPGFPSDPGCTSTQDNDETDTCPTGPGCPQCGDDVDNDSDGFTDFPMDLGCVSASGANEECASVDPIIPFTANVVGASTAGHANDVDLSCGADGRDDVYRLRLTSPLSELRANTVGSAQDTILAIKRGGCASFDLQCDDDAAGSGDSAVFLIDLPAGDYFLIVDDKNAASPLTYNLNVSGLYADDAPCDPTSTLFACNPGRICAGTTPTCIVAACNDTVDADGDTFPGYPTDPGCTSTSDNDETDACPTGPGCPECSDDLDNDNDTFFDYPADVQCSSASASSESCTSIDPVIVYSTPVTGANTAGHVNDVDLSCGVDGRDDIYRVTVTQPLVTLSASTDTSAMNTAVAIRSGASCNGTTDLNCGTNNVGTGDAIATISTVAAGDYFVIVDDLNTTSPSTYNLRITGTIAPGNTCNPTSTTFVCTSGNACYGPAGAETCQVAACNDAVDADGDGFNGFPTDPGCVDASDNTETDTCPSGPGCPQCSDDLDNDGDSRIDYPADFGCSAASTNSEVECQIETDPLIPVVMAATPGTTVGAANNLRPTCGSTSTFTAPDRVHTLTVRVPLATLHIDTSPTGFDNAITLSDATCGPTIQCADAPTIDRTNVAPGAYTIIVDGWSSGSGTYTLNVRGTIANGGACNDPLVAAGLFTCSSGFACTGPAGAETCSPAACNDAVDADGDTFPGYPSDPGCTSVSDGDETDDCPSGPGCPACGDHVDNDTDTLTDWPDDFGCVAASGASERECPLEVDPLIPVAMPATPGTTVGAGNQYRPTCGSTTTFTAPDRVHVLTLRVPVATLHVDTSPTGFDNAISLTDATCGSTIQCADSPTINRTNVPAGAYGIIVDGWSSGSGTYTLNVSGTIAPNGSCADPLVAAGILTCAAGNTCAGPAGMEICVPPACGDLLDNDGDGFVSYPFDPGCSSATDNDETDNCPSGPGCPQCSDDLDNDGDGLFDYPMDPGCAAAGGTTELGCPAELDPLLMITGPTSTGTTVGAMNNFNPTCQPNDLGDRVYMMSLAVPVATLVMDTEGSTLSDPILMFTDATCALPPIACDDDGGTGNQSLITRTNVLPGGYAIVVDHYEFAGTVGPYQLNVVGVLPAGGSCADPLVAAGVLACPVGQSCMAGVCSP